MLIYRGSTVLLIYRGSTVLLISTVFPSPMRNEHCAPASIAPNSRRFEGFLLVSDSDYSGIYTLVTDNHLLGMRPACKQLYFLGHLQNHNWWYCATWIPTLMFSCWLCIDCLLNNWNLMDQFSKLLSNITWSFSFESSWNHIPKQSPTMFSYNKHWMFENERFESFLLSNLDFKSFSKCIFFVWDGNHM